MQATAAVECNGEHFLVEGLVAENKHSSGNPWVSVFHPVYATVQYVVIPRSAHRNIHRFNEVRPLSQSILKRILVEGVTAFTFRHPNLYRAASPLLLHVHGWVTRKAYRNDKHSIRCDRTGLFYIVITAVLRVLV